MDFRDYLEVLDRQKLVILATVVVAIAVATAITLAMTPIYTATALLRISAPVIGSVDYNEMMYAERVNNTYIKILTGWPVMDSVASTLGIPRTGLESKIKVEVIRDTELIRITAEDRDRNVAKNVVATLADIALDQNHQLTTGRTTLDVLSGQLDRIQQDLTDARATLSASQNVTATDEYVGGRVRSLEETYSMLLREYQQARVRDAVLSNSVSVVEPASASSTPIKPNKEQNIALGAVLGLLAGIGIAFLRESMIKAVRTTEDLERDLKISVLGTLPKFKIRNELPELVIANSTAGHAVERYRLLRARLQASSGDNQFKTLLFTSARPGEGKSTVVTNLAVAAAQAKQRVVVVDADFRRPSINRVFGLSNDSGLSNALLGEHRVSSLLRATEFDGLKVLTSGPIPTNPDVALDPRAVGALLTELTEAFDLVLFDGPPASIVADACIIAPLFEGVVVVAKYDHTPPGELKKTIALLKGVNANIVGAVINGYQPNGSAYYYNKYYENVYVDAKQS